MAVRYLKIAVVYFAIAVLLGIWMGIAEKFDYTTVHAHLNLLGWVSLALFGLIYHHYPQAGETGLAKAHFWLHNIGLPVMQGGLFLAICTNNQSFIMATIAGSILIVIGVLLFAWNVLINVKQK